MALRGVLDHRQRLVERGGLEVDVAGGQAEIDPALVALDRQHREAGHGRGQGLRAAHAAEAAGQDPAPLRPAAEMLVGDGVEGLVGALHDALAADVDPGPGGHLAVHHQALAIELVKMLPGRPVRHEVGVGEQNARCVGVGLEHAHGLARLDQERLVVLQPLQHLEDPVEALPVARRPADAAIDDERFGMLGDLGVEIVLRHAVGGLGEPALAGAHRPARGADDAVRQPGPDHGLASSADDLAAQHPLPQPRRHRLVDQRIRVVHGPDGEVGVHARRQHSAPAARPSARAASRVIPASDSSTVRPNRMQAMLAISRSEAKGEVPGLRSVATAIGTPARRRAATGGACFSRRK